jgi:hypothetical protein
MKLQSLILYSLVRESKIMLSFSTSPELYISGQILACGAGVETDSIIPSFPSIPSRAISFADKWESYRPKRCGTKRSQHHHHRHYPLQSEKEWKCAVCWGQCTLRHKTPGFGCILPSLLLTQLYLWGEFVRTPLLASHDLCLYSSTCSWEKLLFPFYSHVKYRCCNVLEEKVAELSSFPHSNTPQWTNEHTKPFLYSHSLLYGHMPQGWPTVFNLLDDMNERIWKECHILEIVSFIALRDSLSVHQVVRCWHVVNSLRI